MALAIAKIVAVTQQLNPLHSCYGIISFYIISQILPLPILGIRPHERKYFSLRFSRIS